MTSSNIDDSLDKPLVVSSSHGTSSTPAGQNVDERVMSAVTTLSVTLCARGQEHTVRQRVTGALGLRGGRSVDVSSGDVNNAADHSSQNSSLQNNDVVFAVVDVPYAHPRHLEEYYGQNEIAEENDGEDGTLMDSIELSPPNTSPRGASKSSTRFELAGATQKKLSAKEKEKQAALAARDSCDRTIELYGPQRLLIPDTPAIVASNYPLIPLRVLHDITVARFWPVICGILITINIVTPLILATGSLKHTLPHQISLVLCSFILGIVLFIHLSQYSRQMSREIVKTFDFKYMMFQVAVYSGCATWYAVNVTSRDYNPGLLWAGIVARSIVDVIWGLAFFLMDASKSPKLLRGIILIVGGIGLTGWAVWWQYDVSEGGDIVVTWYPFRPTIRNLEFGAFSTMAIWAFKFAWTLFVSKKDFVMIGFDNREVHLDGAFLQEIKSTTTSAAKSSSPTEQSAEGGEDDQKANTTSQAGAVGGLREDEEIPSSHDDQHHESAVYRYSYNSKWSVPDGYRHKKNL